MQPRKLGFIGLGKMGKPMARNLLRAGFHIAVYNRSRTTVDELSSAGAEPTVSPKEVALQSEVVFLSLPSQEAVQEVVLGQDGVARGMQRDGIIIDTSTIDPQTTRKISEELRRKGLHILDAPVSGGPEGAENATLTFMVGGEERIFNTCANLFKILGRDIFYMGESGSGQASKLVNQLLVTAHTLATAEAIRFAAAQKLDLMKVVDVIKVSAGDSFVFRRAAPQMVSREFGSGWQTYLMHKDLGLILNSSSHLQLMLPKITAEAFTRAMRHGLGKVDSAAIITTLNGSE